MSTQYEQVIAALDARGHSKGKRYQCPAHGGDGYNLSVKQGQDGQALMTGHSCGCTFKEMMQSLDPAGAGLKPSTVKAPTRRGSKSDTLRLVDTYYYRDEMGDILYRIEKYLDQDGAKTFKQHKHLGKGNYAFALGDTRRVLYNLPQVCDAIAKRKTIWLVEGEKDVETLMFAGLVATCNPMGADKGKGDKFKPGMFACLQGASEICISIDDDDAGEIHGKYIYNQLRETGMPITIWRPTTPGNDITEHYALGGTVDTLGLLDSTKAPTGWADIATLADIATNSWLPVDLGPYLAGTITSPIPTILKRTDGKGLFYKGKVHCIFGDQNSGKTWILSAAFAQEIREAHHVAYIDFEDRATTAIERLTLLGITKDQISEYFHYVRPYDPSDPGSIQQLVAELDRIGVELVGLDSVGEAVALNGINPNADEEIATWMSGVAKKLAETGMTVVLADHAPKGETRPRMPIGSQRKGAAVDGILYRVEMKKPFSQEPSDVPGEIHLITTKDRHGTYKTDVRAAIALVHTGETFSINLYNPQDPIPDHLAETNRARDELTIELVSDWIWTERAQIFSGAICREHIETLKIGAPNLTVRKLEDVVRVLQGVAYSRPEGGRFRLEKRYSAKPTSTGLHATSTEASPRDLHGSTNLHGGSTPTSTLPPRSKSDQSEPTSTLTPPPLTRGLAVEVCEDTTQELDLDLREDPKRFTQ